MTSIKCNMQDCVHNCGLQCYADDIEIVLTHDDDGIAHIECSDYQSDN